MSTWNRLRPGGGAGANGRLARLEDEVAALRSSVVESQRLNERLSDVIDVVCELLVPAVDRDDERLRQALASATRVDRVEPAP